jgi:hypothetical protein
VAPPPVVDRTAEAESGSSAAGGIAVVAIAAGAAAAAICVVALFIRYVSRSRAQRRRDRAAGRKSDQPLPELPEAVGDAVVAPSAQATLIELAAGEAVAYPVGDVPLVIGSDAQADLRIEASRDVAPRHASLWLNDGRITLRHTGGMRPTLVDGRPIEVVILEDGDEFAIGHHRFRAEVSREVPS